MTTTINEKGAGVSTANSRGNLSRLAIKESNEYVDRKLRLMRETWVRIQFIEGLGWRLQNDCKESGYTDLAGVLALAVEMGMSLCPGCGRELRHIEKGRCSDCLAAIQAEDLHLEESLEQKREAEHDR